MRRIFISELKPAENYLKLFREYFNRPQIIVEETDESIEVIPSTFVAGIKHESDCPCMTIYPNE